LFGNLIKNALEASPEGGCVTITLAREGGWGVVGIHNQGCVPSPIREKFFEKFATHGKLGGSGLGCYSAMLMAKVQRADLAMATSEVAGTTLTARFPVWVGKH
ncbi:MAG: ATP-binding protein, partial [Magnetococcales bacterium]|nr:ATP-binding protein [Magnetococcales bacterium]